jgi:hypothetical protein
VRVRAVFDEQAHDRLVPEEDREDERREPVAPLRGGVRSGVEQHARDLFVAARGGAHERRLAAGREARVRRQARGQ